MAAAIAGPTFIGICARIGSGIVHRHQSALAVSLEPGLPVSSYVAVTPCAS